MNNFLDKYHVPEQAKTPKFLKWLKWLVFACSIIIVIYIFSLSYAKVNLIITGLYVILLLTYWGLKLKNKLK